MVVLWHVAALAGIMLTTTVVPSMAMDGGRHPPPGVPLSQLIPLMDRVPWPPVEQAGSSTANPHVDAEDNIPPTEHNEVNLRDTLELHDGYDGYFRAAPYQINRPDFKHFYASDPPTTAGYDLGTGYRHGYFNEFWVRPISYHPEPKLLTRIKEVIGEGSKNKGIQLLHVAGPAMNFDHGSYLEPLLQTGKDGLLEFPGDVLKYRYSRLLQERLARTKTQGVFKLNLPEVKDPDQVLIAEARPHKYVKDATREKVKSDLWLIYLRRVGTGKGRPPDTPGGLSLLGAMFMPERAAGILDELGLLTKMHPLRPT